MYEIPYSIGFQGKVVFVIYYNEIHIQSSIWKYSKALLAMQFNNLLSVREFDWFNAAQKMDTPVKVSLYRSLAAALFAEEEDSQFRSVK